MKEEKEEKEEEEKEEGRKKRKKSLLTGSNRRPFAYPFRHLTNRQRSSGSVHRAIVLKVCRGLGRRVHLVLVVVEAVLPQDSP